MNMRKGRKTRRRGKRKLPSQETKQCERTVTARVPDDSLLTEKWRKGKILLSIFTGNNLTLTHPW